MKCFHYFKERSRSKEPRSEPILKNTSCSTSNNSSAADQRMIKSSGSTTSPRGIPQMFREKGMNLRVFSFSELREATNDFSRLLKIGEGGFGSVYKATIKPVDSKSDRILVAIKQLNRDGFQGHKQWVAEVQFLGVVEHSNLVKLIGYCGVDGERGIQRLLVYEFMPNKSLEDHLFSKAYTALSWPNRLQIMLGAAQGLTYLHEEFEVQVIFRDFKSSNVLLDEDFKPKLSDFGLAREGPTGEHTHVSTEVMGTSGYAAPDYIETGRLTSKTDVWSFGVVLYEILTGRRSLDRNRPRSEQNLLEWIKNYPADSKKFGIIMDPRLESNYSLSAAREIARLADSCLMKSSKDRPTMSQVVERLKQIIQHVDKESPSSKILEFTEDDDEIEVTTKPKDRNVSESTKRRMAQLVKLGEHAGGGINKRGFMIMQRAEVP